MARKRKVIYCLLPLVTVLLSVCDNFNFPVVGLWSYSGGFKVLCVLLLILRLEFKSVIA